MPASLTPLLRRLRRVAAPAAGSDAELLDRFARQWDEAAFAALVARYGRLVRHVCRRVVGDSGAAGAAAQATFLVLARKAAAVGRPEALAGWLYRVAHRIAGRARAGRARRRSQERPAQEDVLLDPHTDPLAEVSARELLGIIDEEVLRLPERYRLPLLLCVLEGYSQEEAARRLSWIPGSVKGRLERGRKQLHARLSCRPRLHRMLHAPHSTPRPNPR